MTESLKRHSFVPRNLVSFPLVYSLHYRKGNKASQTIIHSKCLKQLPQVNARFVRDITEALTALTAFVLLPVVLL